MSYKLRDINIIYLFIIIIIISCFIIGNARYICMKLVLGQGMSGALLAKLWLVYPPLFSLSRQVEELESFEL